MNRHGIVDHSISLPVLGRLTVDDKTGYRPPSGRPKKSRGHLALKIRGPTRNIVSYCGSTTTSVLTELAMKQP
jgi:hypothetical protein